MMVMMQFLSGIKVGSPWKTCTESVIAQKCELTGSLLLT